MTLIETSLQNAPAEPSDVGPPRTRPAYRFRRPALVWLTQIFLLVLMSLDILMVGSQLLLTYPPLQALPGWERVALWLWDAGLLAALATLSYGLLQRRRWAWHGSILFAAYLLFLQVRTFWQDWVGLAGDPSELRGRHVY